MSQDTFSRLAVEVVLLTENFHRLSGSVPPYEYYRNHVGNIVQVEQLPELSHNLLIEIVHQSGIPKDVFMTKYQAVLKVIEEELWKQNHK